MDEFKEYLRFPEIEKATEYTTVLEKHNIPFQLDDSSKRAKIISVAIDDPWSDQYILKLRESDIERAEKAFNEELDNEVKLITHEHYLYSFADKDILDVIANQVDWTKEEVKLAMKIANERKLDLTATSIKSAKKVPEKTTKKKLSIKESSSWFWTFGFLSISNSILSKLNINFHLPGLTFNQALDTVSKRHTTNEYGFFLSLLIASLLFIIAWFGKKNKWVFLSGIIVLGLDTIGTVISRNWFDILFHFFALWSIITGFANSFKTDEINAVDSSTNA